MSAEVRATPHDELVNFDYRVVVFGSRGYDDYESFAESMDLYVQRFDPEKSMIFLSGMASSGADALIVRWCKERGRPWAEFPAAWDDIAVPGAVVRTNRQGKPYNVVAGFQRNRKMAAVSSNYVSFYDGSSPGTKDMLDVCKGFNLAPMIFMIDIKKEA